MLNRGSTVSMFTNRELFISSRVTDHTVLFSGHSDTVMGVICTNNEELCNRLRFLQNCKSVDPLGFLSVVSFHFHY